MVCQGSWHALVGRWRSGGLAEFAKHTRLLLASLVLSGVFAAGISSTAWAQAPPVQGSARLSRDSPTVGKSLVAHPRSGVVAHTNSPLGTYWPTISCEGQGSNSFTGTHLDGSGLKLAAKERGSGLDTHVQVSLEGTMTFALDIHVSGEVTCMAEKLVPIPDSPDVLVGPDFTLDAHGTVDADLTWSPNIDVGFDLSRHGFTHRTATFIDHPDFLFTGEGSATLGLDLKARIGPAPGRSLSAGLEGTVGPQITATVRAGTVAGTSCWSVRGHVETALRAYWQVWSWLGGNREWEHEFGSFQLPERCTDTGTTNLAPEQPPSPPSAPA
jgi:hypothetical protein